MKQAIGLLTGTDPAPFWENFPLHYYLENYMSSLTSSGKIKAGYCHSAKRFIDDLYTINDG